MLQSRQVLRCPTIADDVGGGMEGRSMTIPFKGDQPPPKDVSERVARKAWVDLQLKTPVQW